MYSFHNFLYYILLYYVLYILSINFEKTLCTLDLYKALILRFQEHWLFYDTDPLRENFPYFPAFGLNTD